MARFMRSYGKSDLRPPVVVGPGIAWHGPGVYLTSPTFISDRSRRRDVDTRLAPPAVVTPVQTQVFFGPKVTLNVQLADSRRLRSTRRSPDYELKPPLVINTPAVVQRLNINLVPQNAWVRRRVAPPHMATVLRPPTVVTTPVFTAAETRLAYSRRPKPRSTYVYPIVVFRAEAWGYVATQYVRRPNPSTLSKLSAPVVITAAGVVFPGLRIKLVFGTRGKTSPVLRGPVIVLAAPVEAYYGPNVTLVLIRPKPTVATLQRPAVIAGSIAFRGPGVYLVRSLRARRGKAKSVLSAPRVVFPFLAQTTQITLAQIKPPPTIARLSPPTVVQAFIARDVQTSLNRIKPSPTVSRLAPPTVVYLAVEIYGPQTWLSPSFRGQTASALRRPAVVEIAPEAVTYVNRYVLAPSTRGVAKSYLFSPVVIGAGVVFPGLRIKLAFGKRGVPKSKLQPPAVVDPFRLALGPELHLTPGRRPKTKSVLRAPRVVFQIVYSGPSVWLAPPRRLVAKSQLLPPIVIGAGIVFPGLRIKLAFGKRGVPKSQLSPPVAVTSIVSAFYGPQITLVRIRPRLAHPFLSEPTVVNPGDPFDGPGILLTRSFRGQTSPVLRGPVVVEVAGVVTYVVRLALAPSTRGRAKSKLFRPVVVTAAEFFFGTETKPVRIRPASTIALLKPPAVVSPVLFFGPTTELAPSFHGQTASSLKRPTAVNLPPAYTQVLPPALAYSRRGRPIYFLNPPTVVAPVLARKSDVTFAPQRRGQPTYFLRPAMAVRLAVEIYGPETQLARIKPKPTITVLRPPTDVSDAQDIGTLETHLARSKRGKPTSFLSPPAVVATEPFRGIVIWLAPSSRGQAFHFRIPPAVGEVGSAGPEIHLTRITPPPVLSLLKPPAVIGAGIAFYGPEVHFVRIKPRQVMHAVLKAFVVEAPFVPPRGHVCGFDIAGSFVCYIELPGTKASGRDRAGSKVHGTTGRSAKVTGSDNAGGSASGGDRAAE